MSQDAGCWVERLGLQPHPEGGWFRRIHTAAASITTPAGERSAASAIHYLLTREQPRSRFHRVRSGILHFLQSGGPVQYACMDALGVYREHLLGFGAGQQLYLEVPAQTWKASRLAAGAEHALVSEVVIPGFDWADHEYLDPDQLPAALALQLRETHWID